MKMTVATAVVSPPTSAVAGGAFSRLKVKVLKTTQSEKRGHRESKKERNTRRAFLQSRVEWSIVFIPSYGIRPR